MSLAVLINLHSRRGSSLVADRIHRLFPDARVVRTSSIDQMEAFVREELRARPPSLLLAGGGDGTITGLINALIRHGRPLPPIGILPLGTGNAWARVSGAGRPNASLARLAKHGDAPLPLRRFNLVRVEGAVAPFAGTGWDAEILSDFKAQLETWPAGPIRDAHRGLRGYLGAMYTRTVARHLLGNGPPRLRIINLGEDVMGVDARGRAIPLPQFGHGSVLYDGICGVAGASTTPEYGFGLRAYPFAELFPDRLNVRVYGAPILQGVVNSLRLWRGVHPLKDMHDFFVTRARMEFDREVPVQVAGDVLGPRTAVEYELDPNHVRLLDWSRL